MNRNRRKQLSDIADQIDALITSLEIVKDEEQEALENRPDSLQQTEASQQSESAVGALEEHIDNLNQMADELREL